MKKFIYLKNEIQDKDIILQKNEVGMVISETNDNIVVQFTFLDHQITVDKNDVIFFNPEMTGDLFEKKICNRCNRLLPVEQFQKNQTGKDNRIVRRPSCNNCRKEIDGKNVSSSDKRKWEEIKPNYEIWECPICKKKTIPGITSKIVLDHNHNTGKPRAWICDSCNTGLGRFKDDISIMQNAIDYLLSYE